MADTIFVMSPSPGFFHIQSQQKVQSLPVAKSSFHVPVFVQPLSKTRRSIRAMPMFDPTFYGGFWSIAAELQRFGQPAATRAIADLQVIIPGPSAGGQNESVVTPK